MNNKRSFTTTLARSTTSTSTDFRNDDDRGTLRGRSARTRATASDRYAERLAPEVSGFRDGTTTWDVLQVLVDGDHVAFAALRRATRADGRPYHVEYVFLPVRSRG